PDTAADGALVPTVEAPKKKDNTPEFSVLAQTAEAQQQITGWLFMTSLSHDMGLGTLTNPDRADARYFGASLDLRATYLFNVAGKKLAASAGGALGWQYTQPDLVNGRRFDWGDLRLALTAPAIIREKVTGVGFTPRFGFTVPISIRSRAATTLSVISAGADFTRTFAGKVDLVYRLTGSRGFHARSQIGTPITSVVTPSNFGTKTFVCRSSDTFCDYGGQNTAWSLGNMIYANWRITDAFAISGSVVLQNNWRYPVTDVVDEFTPKATDSNGNAVAKAGYGRADVVQASAGASYAITDSLQTGLGLGYEGAPLNDNNSSLRSPFAYGAGNYLSFSLSVSALF
ncbi:MAG: hypothetical protein ACT4TC_01680, partial [Myxococcaceae bacterium]